MPKSETGAASGCIIPLAAPLKIGAPAQGPSEFVIPPCGAEQRPGVNVRQHTIEAIKRITRGLAEAAEIPQDRSPIVTIADESASATYNQPELSRRLLTTFKGWFGESSELAKLCRNVLASQRVALGGPG